MRRSLTLLCPQCIQTHIEVLPEGYQPKVVCLQLPKPQYVVVNAHLHKTIFEQLAMATALTQ
jgi:hypothetical protein